MTHFCFIHTLYNYSDAIYNKAKMISNWQEGSISTIILPTSTFDVGQHNSRRYIQSDSYISTALVHQRQKCIVNGGDCEKIFLQLKTCSTCAPGMFYSL